MPRALLLLAALVLLFACGCSAEEGTPIAAWHLLTADGAEEDIVLPAHPRVPRDEPFTLRAHVERPAALRTSEGTLSISHLYAPVTLREGGRDLSATIGEPEYGAYRSSGAHAWRIPPGDRDLELELVVDHRWMGSAYLDAVPRLTNGIAPARPLVFRRYATDLGMTLALGILPPLGLVYLVLFLGDRRRREYLWFATQMFTGTYYALWTLGVTARVLGTLDIVPFAMTQALSPLAGIYLLHSVIVKDRPAPRAVLWLFLATIAVTPLLVMPYAMEYLAWALLPIDVVGVGIMLIELVRAARGTGPTATIARLFLAAVVTFALAVSVEGPWWVGMGDRIEGFRPAGWSLIALAAVQTVMLGLEHRRASAELAQRVAMLEEKQRTIGQLNEELRRQIAERSSELATALARLESDVAPELAKGDTIDDRYVVEAPLGKGGMGAVYRVERIGDRKRFALKVMSRRIDDRASTRFAREVEVLSRITHPNVVSVVDVNIARAGFLYLVMEYVDGESLSQARARFGDVAWALPALAEIAAGLAAIHEAGVVHRDLKPSNVLVTKEGTTKICDFGIAKAGRFDLEGAAGGDRDDASSDEATRPVDPEGPPPSSRRDAPSGAIASEVSTSVKTAAGTLGDVRLGTPLYMAPEAIAGDAKPHPARDVYALGLLAFEMLTGKHPRRDAVAEPAHDVNPAVPERVSHALAKALSIQAERRPTAKALAAIFAEAPQAGAAKVFSSVSEG